MTSPPKPASAVAAAFAELTQSFMAAATSPQAAQPLSGAKRGHAAEGDAGQQERSVRAKVGVQALACSSGQ